MKKVKNNKIRKGYQLPKNSLYSNFESSRIGFLDPHKYVRLDYAQAFSSSVTSAAAVSQVMNLNSIFDPDRTGSGHQPYGHDALAALYNRYRVLKAHYRVTFGTSTGTYHFTVAPINGVQTNATDQASFQLIAESPRAVSGMQGGGGAPSVIITRKISLSALTGVTQVEYLADDRFEAVQGASPAELLTLNISFYNPTASTLTVYAFIEIQFLTDLHDPLIQNSS